MSTNLTCIPTIDLSEASDSARKPQILKELGHVLLNVGFLYVCNHGVPEQTIQDLIKALPVFFGLSTDEKAEVGLLNSPHFLGYSGIGAETTAGKVDLREQFEFATELEDDWSEGRPIAERLKGPNQVWKHQKSRCGAACIYRTSNEPDSGRLQNHTSAPWLRHISPP